MYFSTFFVKRAFFIFVTFFIFCNAFTFLRNVFKRCAAKTLNCDKCMRLFYWNIVSWEHAFSTMYCAKSLLGSGCRRGAAPADPSCFFIHFLVQVLLHGACEGFAIFLIFHPKKLNLTSQGRDLFISLLETMVQSLQESLSVVGFRGTHEEFFHHSK